MITIGMRITPEYLYEAIECKSFWSQKEGEQGKKHLPPLAPHALVELHLPDTFRSAHALHHPLFFLRVPTSQAHEG